MDNIINLKPKKYSGTIFYVHFCLLIFLTVIVILVYLFRFVLGIRPEWLWKIEFFEFIHDFYGILFVVPIIYAAIIFWWRGVLITWLFSIAIVMPILIFYRTPIQNIVVNFLLLSIPLILVGYIDMELRWRRKERNIFMEVEKERQSYLAQIFKAHEDERRLIAQELHDDAIQCLLAVARTQQGIAKMDKNTNSREQVLLVRDEILRISDELKRLTLDLRPGILDNLGLIPALHWLVENISRRANIDVQLTIVGDERELPTSTDVTIFRIVQEGLNNISSHSKSNKAMVYLEFLPEKLKLSIIDDGMGFDVPRNINTLLSSKKLGLVGIQERARSLGGNLHIRSKPKEGTCLLLEIPH